MRNPDHIGVDFWRAFRAFETAMFEDVATLGFAGLSQADSDVLVHIGRDGASMAAIARARGVSKQAMQGQVRSLVNRGYLTVEPDPHDARARIVRHSDKGLALVLALGRVKIALNTLISDALGDADMHRLRVLLQDAVRVIEGRDGGPRT